MALVTRYINVVLTGASGTQADTRNVAGELKGIYVKYTGQPGTCVVAVRTKGSNSPSQALLTLTAANTSGWFRPLVAQNKTDGSAALYAVGFPVLAEIVVDDFIEVAVSSGAAGNVEVWAQVEEE